MKIELNAMGAIDVAFFFIAATATLLYVWRLAKDSWWHTRWPFVLAHLLGLAFCSAFALDTLDGKWAPAEVVGIGIALLWLWMTAGQWRHGPPKYARIRQEQPGDFNKSRLP